MCGIAGICLLRGPGNVSVETLSRMTGILRHRGPDESGIYVDDQVGLGHARLSIIDLAGGTQPIPNEDESLWIVFNGEIFNYPELRDTLLSRGHRFKTATDTEVILHLFEEKGPACLSDLNGQFAFAIWDSKAGELFLARDRAGIRPLHYVVTGDRLLFASEIKSIFQDREIPRKFDPEGIDQVFTFWTTLPGKTVFDGVRELPPGHFMQVGSGNIHIRRFWDFSFELPGDQLDWPVGKIADTASELLLDSTRIRLRADVPVGCYLSGGLDSSIIATLVRRNFRNELRTFGVRFEEERFDEGAHQATMVDHLGVLHTEVRVSNMDIGKHFPEAVRHCEKPLLRTAPVPMFLLSDAVRRTGYKVVLTGEGADEIFGGYDIFREALLRRFWSRQPDSRLRPLLLGKLYPYIFNDPRLRNTLQSFFRIGFDRHDDPFYSHRHRWENTSRNRMFFSEEMKRATQGVDGLGDLEQRLPDDFPDWDTLAKAQYLEMVLFLGNYLLSSQGDRVAMAHSLEIRLPYLDYRLVEFLGKVPSKWKIFGMQEKHLLKRMYKDAVPESVVRRPKHPYRAPILEGLFTGNQEEIRTALSESALRKTGMFDPKRVSRLLEKVRRAGQASEVEGMAIAGIASTQILSRQFIEEYPLTADHPLSPIVFVDRRTNSIGSDPDCSFTNT